MNDCSVPVSEWEALDDGELELLALNLSVLHPNWRPIWQEYEKRNFGLLAQVLARREAEKLVSYNQRK